ncbi:MAG: Stk1 family PASTA domain-containing Ser/Thr kinase [Firmicutes bacterium]|jgi:serine/threonine-protein kinase|nr:Stk1 family PASTA domain-containing Ser/Thr kinase [Bacillota bacterium]
MIGRVLGGRYEVLEKIGGGGMAVVYRAHDNYLNRSVAVKVLRPQFSGDDDFVKRFRREAQAAASLSHPNIVNIFDVGEIDDTHYIVMEYVDGLTLKQVIASRGRLSPTQALKIAHQICEALDHAHRRHVIHRDIKPQNILIDREGRAKVTDFGIARAATSSTVTHTGTVIGSVHYFSPEQARGGFTGERSDIYSLGVVMYEMVTGKVPFQGDSPITIALKHVQEEVESVKKASPDVPDEVATIIARALRKNQYDRYQSASEMLKDIREALTLMGEDVDVAAGEDLVEPEAAREPDDAGRTATRVRPKGGSGLGWLKWFVPLVLVACAVAWGLREFREWIDVPVMQVPSVVGKSLSDAERELSAAGLVPSVVAQKYDDATPAGHVISQVPEAGESVKVGRTVNLVVSQGQEFTLVPDVVMKPLLEAEGLLAAAGLDIGSITGRYHPTVPEDVVMSQNPRKDTRVAKGTLVDIEVSKGPEPASIAVPDFTGESVEQAVQKIMGLKLAQGTITETEAAAPPGTVIGQDPPKGSEVSEGTPVNLVVSKGPAPTDLRRSVVEVTVPLYPDRVEVKLTIQDAAGTRLAYRNKHEPGSKVPIEVQWVGTEAIVRVFFDDSPSGEIVLR